MTSPRTTCPNCGAEIVFRWSGAVQTTCPACRSILVRHDVDLQKVGQVGDVPASMSGIQLGTEGRFKNAPFVVVGRIIYTYSAGHWSEWHIRFADDTSGWLSDAQGEYVVTRASTRKVTATAENLGESIRIGDKQFTLAAITRASYAGVEGELPFEYWDKAEVRFLDLRGEGDTFATLDESETPRLLFIGEFEQFAELHLKNLREVDAPAAAAPKPRGFNCPSCGAAIVLRTGDLAHNVACSACGSIVDAKDPNFAILQGHQANMRGIKPAIPLGTVGHLKGEAWQAIGFQVRGIEVDGTRYLWREFLLWNAAEGFRYLTEYEGHWNDVTTVKGWPHEVSPPPQPVVEYLGIRFKHFQGAIATTHFVLGEFPWQVRVGDRVWNDDFVAPPLMLSREKTDDEITWSMGTYTSPKVIAEAFKLSLPLPAPSGVFANQPNPHAGIGREFGRIFAMLAAALFVLFVVRQATASRRQVFSAGYRYNPSSGDTVAFVSPVFTIPGHASNVEVTTTASVMNDWAYFNIALLEENGGTGYELGREVSYYQGVDDGEAWSEGSNTDRVMLPSVPPGQYYLRIDPEHDLTRKSFNYSITIRRDVPRAWPFLVAFVVLLIPVLIAWGMEGGMERLRWAESDYAPVASDDDDE